MPIRVTVWGENQHEQKQPEVRALYPDGMHGAIAAGISENLGDQVTVRTAVLDDDEHGLTDEVLAETDVLTWWGHMAHDRVDDKIVERVHARVLEGMGILVLHSGHFSKIFFKLMGTRPSLHWRNDAERELVWTVKPGHPITNGVPNPVVIPQQEMYGEPFGIPDPDELVFVSSFEGGEIFRSGCCYTRGAGRVFYFSPGDQEYPVYQQAEIRKIISNGVLWAAPTPGPVGPLSGPEMHKPEKGWFLK